MDRYAEVTRKTGETDIVVKLDLDGSGVCDISTGVPFFDHMLNAFGRHGLFDLTVHAVGDVEVDAHHTVEDVGIVLGEAFCQALGDKAGITRFADAAIAMDETLVMAAVDISGRGQAYCELPVPTERVGSFDTELAVEFFYAFARDAKLTLHVRELAGGNSHHIIEAAFKAVGRTMRHACEHQGIAVTVTRVKPPQRGQAPLWWFWMMRSGGVAWANRRSWWLTTTRATCRALRAGLRAPVPPPAHRTIRSRSVMPTAWSSRAWARSMTRSPLCARAARRTRCSMPSPPELRCSASAWAFSYFLSAATKACLRTRARLPMATPPSRPVAPGSMAWVLCAVRARAWSRVA